MPPPTKTGAAWRAWQANTDAYRARIGKTAQDDATLAFWIVEAPWAHPIWHSYLVALVHLRPLPEGRKTILYRDDATHEFWVYALDPEKPRAPAALGQALPALLTPMNFAAQLAETSDAAAVTKIEGAVDLIIAGELNPDTDAIRQWRAIFGDAMIRPEYR